MSDRLPQIKVAVVQATPILFDREAKVERALALSKQVKGGNMQKRITFLALLLISFIFILISSTSAEKPAQVKRVADYLAVFDLEVTGIVDPNIVRPLTDSIRMEVVKLGKYQVIDRSNMEKILKEQAFQLSGCVAKECAVEAGQMLGVGKVIIGSLGLVGRTYYLSLSQVDVETGKTEAIEEDICKCEPDELIASTKRAARKLMGETTPAPSAPAEVEVAPPTATVEPAVTSKVAAAPAPSGRTLVDPMTSMEFVLVKGGCFEMGDTFGGGDSDERPVHEVCVDDFYMGKYEVTQGQWKEIMGSNPSNFQNGDRYPVETVSWHDVQDFIRKLNQRTAKAYRLPTEAEWEYAARSGGKEEKWAGTRSESELERYAWYEKNSGGRTHPVGEKVPNGLGLYDMTGNVREWVADWCGYYRDSPKDNPQGPSSGQYRVFRGGSWGSSLWDLRSSSRLWDEPSIRHFTLGFRLALPPR